MRSQPVRVAIDLETTGLHPEQDAVIEVGAIKFAGDDVIETFESFVATAAPLPYRVQRLTGIKPAQLRQAPQMSELTPRLRAFLGDLPLVGHSVPFDVAFLRRVGLARHNPLVDTYELATALLPNLASYTLGAVGTALGVSSPTYHRALADAQLSRDVFLALLSRLEALDSTALEALGRLPAPADWTPAFFVRAELRARGAMRPRVSDSLGAGGTLGDQLAAKLGLDPSVLALAVAPGVTPARGRGSQDGDTGEESNAPVPDLSKTQETLIQTIMDCFESGGPLLAEVESDSASRQACLIAALRWAQQRDERVLICAPTREAMNQVMATELPAAFRAAGIGLSQLAVADVDEDDAYLCLHRWYGAGREARDGSMSRDVTRGLAKLTVWAGQSQTGRRAEVTLASSDLEAWERVRSGEEFHDSVSSCAYRRDGYCYTTKAREQASQARLVVTTHAALAARLNNAESLLPDVDRVLVLDGHLLEEQVRGALGFALDRQQFTSVLDTLAIVESEGRRAGLLHMAASRAEPRASDREQAWFTIVKRARAAVDTYFQALRHVMREVANGQENGASGAESAEQQTLLIDAKARQLRAWQSAASACADLSQRCDDLGKVAREAARLPAAGRGKTPNGLAADGVAVELFGCARKLERLCRRGSALFDGHGQQNTIFWLRIPAPAGAARSPGAFQQRGNQRGGRADADRQTPQGDAATPAGVHGAVEENTEPPAIHCAPVRIGAAIEPLWQPSKSLALTGPALAVAGDFTFARGALGLPEHTMTRGSQADREQQTLLCLPDDVPEPNVSQYQRHLDDALVALATALGGRLVAIFPSHAALRSSAQNIRRTLEQRDILVMAQGQDGSARQLWQAFSAEERVVLLGAGAFWDGDAQGRAPACIVVTRAPFPAMSDPLLAARANQWQDQQAEFVVPHAALRIRQALSGLAWSHQERNAVVLFDRRLQTRAYGPTILGTLPRCAQYQEAMARITERVTEWLG